MCKTYYYSSRSSHVHDRFFKSVQLVDFKMLDLHKHVIRYISAEYIITFMSLKNQRAVLIMLFPIQLLTRIMVCGKYSVHFTII